MYGTNLPTQTSVGALLRYLIEEANPSLFLCRVFHHNERGVGQVSEVTSRGVGVEGVGERKLSYDLRVHYGDGYVTTLLMCPTALGNGVDYKGMDNGEK